MTSPAHSIRGFVAASLSLATLFASSAAPIPLYALYRQENGLGYNDLALTAVGYFAGAVTALLMLGRLSNHLGRKPVTLLALILSAIACVFFLDVTSAAQVICGRILQGLSCGLASSAIAAFIVDSAPPKPHWLAATAASGLPLLGLTIGALGSGGLVEVAPFPRLLPFVVVIAMLAACAILVTMSPETVNARPGAWRSLRPHIALPTTARRLFPVAAATFVATWALGGFYQAFGPVITAEQLGSHNAFVIAAVFSSLMAPSVFGGGLAGRFSPARAQKGAMAVFTLAVIGIVLSLKAGMIIPFLACSTIAGAAQGATMTASIRSLLSGCAPQERAGIFSTIYATSYVGAALPSFLAGRLAEVFSLLHIASGYAALAALGFLFTVFRPAGSSQEP